MNFSKDITKLIYAAIKILLVLTTSIVYIAGGKTVFRSLLGIGIAEQEKSYFLFGLLVILTIYRDKHEKKIVSTYDPSKLHFGRALLTPLVYVSFTVMMIMEQSILSLLVASIYQVGFFYFYFDDATEMFLGKSSKEIN
jgi:hypothetical protein